MLVDIGVLVGVLEFLQMVDVDVGFVWIEIFCCLDNDMGCIDLVDNVCLVSVDGSIGVVGYDGFYVGFDEWCFGLYQWYGLMYYV